MDRVELKRLRRSAEQHGNGRILDGQSASASRRGLGSAHYSGYQMSVDQSLSLAGCREGTVVIELRDPANLWALLKRYTVTVDAGP